MTYEPKEISREDGSPVELYTITLGSQSWHFTSGAEEIELDMDTYVPLPVSRDAVTIGKQDLTQEVGVVLPGDHEFVSLYKLLVPASKAFLTIRRFHRTDDDVQVIALFKGVVSAIKFEGNGATASIGVAPLTDNLNLTIPRYVYSSLCNHVLGDRWCTKNLDTQSSPDMFAYKFVGNANTVERNRIIVDGLTTAAYPDNFFAAGKVVTAAGDQRLVTHSNGNNLFVYVPFFEGTALEGHNVTCYAGCDHSLDACKSKFDNVINYGGFPAVPKINIFQTGLI